MSTPRALDRSLQRIASHRPMHDLLRVALNAITHPAVLLLAAFVLLASATSNALVYDEVTPPIDTIVYYLAIVPAGLAVHFLTAPCSVEQGRVIARVAHEDPYVGPYVSRWIAADRTPSSVEYRLVNAYLEARQVAQP